MERTWTGHPGAVDRVVVQLWTPSIRNELLLLAIEMTARIMLLEGSTETTVAKEAARAGSPHGATLGMAMSRLPLPLVLVTSIRAIIFKTNVPVGANIGTDPLCQETSEEIGRQIEKETELIPILFVTALAFTDQGPAHRSPKIGNLIRTRTMDVSIPYRNLLTPRFRPVHGAEVETQAVVDMDSLLCQVDLTTGLDHQKLHGRRHLKDMARLLVRRQVETDGVMTLAVDHKPQLVLRRDHQVEIGISTRLTTSRHQRI